MNRALASRVRTFTTQEMWGVFQAPWDPGALTIQQDAATPVALPGPDRFIADPFSVAGSPRWALAEELDFRRGPGRIVMLDLDGNTDTGPGTEPTPLIDDGVHSSYPVTYRAPDGELLLVPERARTQRLEFYRLDIDRPSVELVHVEFEGRQIIDPTIVFDNGHYYLFFVDGQHGIDSRLELYVSDSLTGPWQRHRASPIVDDRRWARPAGRLFRTDDSRLVRPAQDCGVRYGGAVALREVTTLTPDDYSEEPAGWMASQVDGFTSGLHTLDVMADGRCLFDAKTYHSSLSTPALRHHTWRRAQRRLRSLAS